METTNRPHKKPSNMKFMGDSGMTWRPTLSAW